MVSYLKNWKSQKETPRKKTYFLQIKSFNLKSKKIINKLKTRERERELGLLVGWWKNL